MFALTTVVVLFSLSYTFALFLVSRRRSGSLLPPPDRLFFVFVLPCLNEEVVIGRSLERLLALASDDFAVLGVRMYNASAGRLPRLQDFEFVTLTEIFQRARQQLGSVGLGGNGQFTRLSALADVGDAPWTDCLTEDLELGVRLRLKGWTNHFCPRTYVSQQAVAKLRPLVRQRSRLFLGHLQ